METLGRLLGAITLPFVILNVLGGVVSGIWLAVLGAWGSIGVGLVFAFGGVGLITIALMPGVFLFLGPASIAENKNKTAFLVFGFLGALWTMLVMTAWCTFVLLVFGNRADTGSLVPHLLWAYGTAMGPIAFMAQKDLQAGNEHGGISCFFAQLGLAITIVTALTRQVHYLHIAGIIGTCMVIGLLLQLVMVVSATKSRREYL
jgi:hypothetical protein